MGNRNRLGVILLLLLSALTGWAQNIRVSSLTATTAITNNGQFVTPAGAGALKIWTSDANGVGSWQSPGSVTDTNALARLNGIGTNATLNGLTVNAGGFTNYGVTYIPRGSAAQPSLTFSNLIGANLGSGLSAGAVNDRYSFSFRSNVIASVLNGQFFIPTNLLLGDDVTFTASNRVNIGTEALPAASLQVGVITLPTVGAQAAPSTGRIKLLNTNNTIHALKADGSLVNLETQSGTDAAKVETNNGVAYRLTSREGMLTTGGGTNNGTAPLSVNSPLQISGGFAMQPVTNATTVISQVTNAYTLHVLAGNTTFTFGGTALNGARGQVDLVNQTTTNITITWPLSYSVPQASGITTFTAYSNSTTGVYWSTVGGSNRVRVAGKEIVESFLNPSAGQLVGFHDPWTKTNVNDQVGAGGALIRVQTNTTTVTSATNINLIVTNNHGLGVLATNNSGTGSADLHLFLFDASATTAGIMTTNLQEFKGFKRWLGNQQILAGGGAGVGAFLQIINTNGGDFASLYLDYLSDGTPPWELRTDSTDDLILSDQTDQWAVFKRGAGRETWFGGNTYAPFFTATNYFDAIGNTNDPGSIRLRDTNHTLRVTIAAGSVMASNLTIRPPTNGMSGANTNLVGAFLADGSIQLGWGPDNTAAGGGDGTGIGVLTNGTSVGIQTNVNLIAGTNGGLTIYATNNSGANRIDARLETTRVGVWRSEFIEAGALRPSTTNGATPITTNIAGGTDYITDDVFEFDDTTEQSVEFKWRCRQWNLGNVSVELYFYSTNVIGTNIYAVKAKSVAANESTSGAWGTGVQNTAASGAVSTTANRLNKSNVVTLTVGGTPADGEVVYFHIARKPGDISDNLAGKSRLAGIMLHYQELATELGAP